MSGAKDIIFLKAQGKSNGLVAWVDDQIVAISSYAELLKLNQFDVILFNSPLLWLKWLEKAQDKVGLLIIDIWMPPGRDERGIVHEGLKNYSQIDMGLAVLEHMHKQNINMPVLILSATILQQNIKMRLMELGLKESSFMSKPPSPERFIRAVKVALSKRV